MQLDLYALGGLGLSFIFYCIARLLNNLDIYFDEKTTKCKFLFDKIIPFLCIAFYFFGLIPAAMIHLIHAYPQRRIEAAAKEEEREFMEKINKSEVRIAVKAEHDRLVGIYEKLIEEEREQVRLEERERFHKFFSEYLKDNPRSPERGQ